MMFSALEPGSRRTPLPAGILSSDTSSPGIFAPSTRLAAAGPSGPAAPPGLGTRPLPPRPDLPVLPLPGGPDNPPGAAVSCSAQDLLLSLTRILETRDRDTYYHSYRVSRYALRLAVALGWPAAQRNVLEAGAWLHDIGKLGLPDQILLKAGPLTAAEYRIVQSHVAQGLYILQGVPAMGPFLPYVAYHHEWYNGRGYPFGLAGTVIPVEGRLLTIADAFDALTSPRPYRAASSPGAALHTIRAAAGTQFDPAIVAVLDTAGLAGEAETVRFWGAEE